MDQMEISQCYQSWRQGLAQALLTQVQMIGVNNDKLLAHISRIEIGRSRYKPNGYSFMIISNIYTVQKERKDHTKGTHLI